MNQSCEWKQSAHSYLVIVRYHDVNDVITDVDQRLLLIDDSFDTGYISSSVTTPAEPEESP